MRRWVTCGSTTLEAMVNPFAAACADGYVPDELVVLENPGIDETVDDALAIAEVVASEYDVALDATRHSLAHERDFEAIAEYYRTALDVDEAGTTDAGSVDVSSTDAGSADARDPVEVAVDVTPGRKFMSAIAFQAGLRYDADHVFYLFLHSNDYYGRVYHDVPSPAAELIDFAEVLA